MRSYDWWQARLTKEFFGVDQAGRPLLFFVDDQEAVRLHGDAKVTDSIDDLCTAVAQEAIDWRGDAYRQIYREALVWKRSTQEGPPPCLPLLAVCVLAATRMRGEGGRGAHAYYVRLAELLRPPPGFQLDDHKKHLQRDYQTVETFWKYLDGWLKEREGTRGFSTLHTSKGRERIGYAQSQALVCAADHDRLAPFFKECQVREPVALLRGLRMWKGRPRLSARLRGALDKNNEDNLLGPLLISIAESDSRVPPVPNGLRRLPLRITAIDDPRNGWTLQWRAERVDGVDGDALTHSGGHLVVAARDTGALYTLSGDLPDLCQGLTAGVTARGERLGISLQPRRHPLILQEDPLGGWTEVEKVVPHTPSLILFDRQGEAEARSLVAREGFSWEEPEESSVDGWFVAADVEFTEGAGARARRPRLTGGLHLRLTGERRHYLVGGEPDLVLPPGVDVVRLDGAPISITGERTELRGRGLAAGEHMVDTEVGRLTFHLHASQDIVLEKTNSPKANSEQPLVQVSTVIDAEGRHTDLASTEPPVWWHERHTGLCGESSAMEIPDSAVWLVIDHPDGTIEVRMSHSEEPRITQVTPAMRKFWKVMFTIERPPPEKLWKRYLNAVLMGGRGRG